MEELDRLLEDTTRTNIEVILLSNKLDGQGQEIVNEGMYVAEIRSIGIHILDEVTGRFLKQEYERLPLLSMLVLWTRYGAGKLGIMRFVAVSKNEPVPDMWITRNGNQRRLRRILIVTSCRRLPRLSRLLPTVAEDL
jgi:hypothetical protein